MTDAVDGISDWAWVRLVDLYRRPDIVFTAALAFGSETEHGLRLLAQFHGINPDA